VALILLANFCRDIADFKATAHRKKECAFVADRLSRNEADILEVYRQFTNSAAVFNDNFRKIESSRLWEKLQGMPGPIQMNDRQYVTGLTTNGWVMGDKSYRFINGIMVEVEK
jgi:hypothetical protein